MASRNYTTDELWKILVETVHAMVMYPHHKGYVRDAILSKNPNITPQELAVRINMPLGESLVILNELKKNQQNERNHDENSDG
ncbi:MAG: hypothetical protein PVF96_03080 [Candidatus Bathyarchaeota archaeon]|jgi:hypothetical protein